MKVECNNECSNCGSRRYVNIKLTSYQCRSFLSFRRFCRWSYKWMGIESTVQSFTEGLGAGATIALSYGLLGGFAIAIAKTGIPELMIAGMLKILNGESNRKGLVKVLIFFLIFVMSILSQNVIPIHIAFIPLLIPPILKILNMLEVDATYNCNVNCSRFNWYL